jgi:hypothetical protein
VGNVRKQTVFSAVSQSTKGRRIGIGDIDRSSGEESISKVEDEEEEEERSSRTEGES